MPSLRTPHNGYIQHQTADAPNIGQGTHRTWQVAEERRSVGAPVALAEHLVGEALLLVQRLLRVP
eukprot:251399-Rhodomonas_salina.1